MIIKEHWAAQHSNEIIECGRRANSLQTPGHLSAITHVNQQESQLLQTHCANETLDNQLLSFPLLNDSPRLLVDGYYEEMHWWFRTSPTLFHGLFLVGVEKWMNGVLGHNSALQGYAGSGTTWANDMPFVMNHDPGAGSLARPIDLQSSALPLCHGYPLNGVKIQQHNNRGIIISSTS